MYLTMNWKEEIATIAGPVDFSDSRDSWLLRAARKAQITHWHAKALFYGELKDPKWSIGIKVANAANKVRRELEAAKQDAASVSLVHQQLARGILNAAHQNLLGTEATALLDSARLLGGLDMPGDHRISIVKK